MQLGRLPQDEIIRTKNLGNGYIGEQVVVDAHVPVINIRKDGILYAVARDWDSALAYAAGEPVRNILILSDEWRAYHAAIETDDQLVGVREAAEILGWDPRRVATYRSRGSFPEPIAELAAGPVWTKRQIERYRKK